MAATLARTSTAYPTICTENVFRNRVSDHKNTTPTSAYSIRATNRQRLEKGFQSQKVLTYHTKTSLTGRLETFLKDSQHSERKARTRGASVAATMSVEKESVQGVVKTGKLTLYDAPISNNGARVRFVIYGKGLENEVEMAKPSNLGGLKSEAFLALNPEGKMPLLVTPEGEGIPESSVISEYLRYVFKDKGPSYEPTPENRVVCSLIERIHDLYIAANQACMYRAMDPAAREQGLREIAKQLRILERYAKAEPYLAGPSETTADHTVFPTMVFIDSITPRVYGWTDYLDDKPKLKKWWNFMSEQPNGKRIRSEIEGAISSWFESGRFESLGITDSVKENLNRYKLATLEAGS